MPTVNVAVPRKGRPLEAVLDRVATVSGHTSLADDVVSTLRYEKAVTKGDQDAPDDAYERLAAYSDLEDPTGPEYTLVRDDRPRMPRRLVFDSVTVEVGGVDVCLVGREEPFRALRKHEVALGFDSADLVLEEVVQLRADPLSTLAEVNERIDPRDTDVRLVDGLGDTVYHTLLASREATADWDGDLTRAFVDNYQGPLCISPRYERLVTAVLGEASLSGVDFVAPDHGETEEAAIAETGVGVYLTVTGGTARDHGLVVGERLFPSETVLLENVPEVDEAAGRVKRTLTGVETETELAIQ
jgi:hypothetical protein